MSRSLRDVAARVDLLLGQLGPALDGTGPALRVAPLPPGAAHRAADEAAGEPDHVPDDVALVVATSGSTGEPRSVLLTGAALRTSARATEQRLSGPGRWLLALPVDHVAGLQVLVRSQLAGTRPAVLADGPFTAAAFTQAARSMADDAHEPEVPRYVSLVPTQLVRVLDDPAATVAARAFDAILLGGAATPGPVLDRARDAGLRVVTTYGMTETCGGCVYDGVPLDGVRVLLDDEGRVLLGGEVLAAGYLGRPDLDVAAFVEIDGTRFLRTSDLGRLEHGRLTVLGRADDVVVTGGVNVAPAAVEAALATMPGIAEALVTGVPDDEWGQAVAALVVLDGAAGTSPVGLEAVRAHVTRALGAPCAPRHLLVVEALPLRGPGKPDRRTARSLVEAHLAPSRPATTRSTRPQPLSPRSPA